MELPILDLDECTKCGAKFVPDTLVYCPGCFLTEGDAPRKRHLNYNPFSYSTSSGNAFVTLKPGQSGAGQDTVPQRFVINSLPEVPPASGSGGSCSILEEKEDGGSQ